MNVCQHRGHQLLTGSGSGKKRIVCPYHAWTYDLDGSLIRAPCTDELPSFKPDSFGLKEIAVAECAGLLFANLTPVSTKHEASVFEDVYPGLKNTLTGHLGNLEGFERKHRIDYQIAANWKVVVDNFSEGYHIPMAHRLLSQVLDSAASSDSRIEKHYAFFESICKSGYAGLDLEPGQPYLSCRTVSGQPGSRGAIRRLLSNSIPRCGQERTSVACRMTPRSCTTRCATQPEPEPSRQQRSPVGRF